MKITSKTKITKQNYKKIIKELKEKIQWFIQKEERENQHQK